MAADVYIYMYDYVQTDMYMRLDNYVLCICGLHDASET